MPIAAPPSPFSAFNTRALPAGTRLVRLHDPAFEGGGPNPCKGGPTRFAPVFQPGGACLPTLYAAATFECAVFESVFHDVPHISADKFVRLSKVTSRSVSWLQLRADLMLASESMQSCGVVAPSREMRCQLTPIPKVRNPPDHASTPQLCMLPCVGAVSAVSLGTAVDRGGTMIAASGWRSATATETPS